MGELAFYANQKNTTQDKLGITPQGLAELAGLVEDGTINMKIAKEVLPLMIETNKAAKQIVEEKGLLQIKDTGALEKVAEEVLDENKQAVDDFAKGKEQSVKFLIGKLMAKTKGKANPKVANQVLIKKLKEKVG
jgi:aspartyl-tRNA(Asn)/glutamyl-tRNA(Gln) amidotransferase subunit B